MKNARLIWFRVLPAVALILGSFLLTQPMIAQAPTPQSQPAAQQQAPPQQKDPAAPADMQTFTGKIVEQDGKLVLSDTENNKIYQLDDQDKAKEFVNKDVKVTGALDAETLVINKIEVPGPSK